VPRRAEPAAGGLSGARGDLKIVDRDDVAGWGFWKSTPRRRCCRWRAATFADRLAVQGGGRGSKARDEVLRAAALGAHAGWRAPTGCGVEGFVKVVPLAAAVAAQADACGLAERHVAEATRPSSTRIM
jgi:hypothetical protein